MPLPLATPLIRSAISDRLKSIFVCSVRPEKKFCNHDKTLPRTPYECNLATETAALFCGCCYYRPSTAVIQPPWSFWIYQRPLTRSTMRSCYSGCRQLLELMTVLIGGFSPTCPAGISTYAAGLRDQPSFTSSVVCLRVLCWDQFCSYCTPWSWSRQTPSSPWSVVAYLRRRHPGIRLVSTCRCGCTFIAGHRTRWCHCDLDEMK